MEETLQQETTPQCFGLPPTCAGNHRSDGPKADHALKIKLDQSGGADRSFTELFPQEWGLNIHCKIPMCKLRISTCSLPRIQRVRQHAFAIAALVARSGLGILKWSRFLNEKHLLWSVPRDMITSSERFELRVESFRLHHFSKRFQSGKTQDVVKFRPSSQSCL